MPSATTTPRQLEEAFAVQFREIVPRHQVQRVAPEGSGPAWAWANDRREISPSLRLRRYTFEWGKAEVVPGGATGNLDTEVSIELRVVTDYRALREEDLGDLTEADFWDLHDRLSERLDPVIPGLMWVEPTQIAVDDAETFTIAHEFRIQYLRNRAA